MGLRTRPSHTQKPTTPLFSPTRLARRGRGVQACTQASHPRSGCQPPRPWVSSPDDAGSHVAGRCRTGITGATRPGPPLGRLAALPPERAVATDARGARGRIGTRRPGPPQVLFGAQKTREPPSTIPQHSSNSPGVEQAPPSGRQHWSSLALPIGAHPTVPPSWQHCSASVQSAFRASDPPYGHFPFTQEPVNPFKQHVSLVQANPDGEEQGQILAWPAASTTQQLPF